MSDDEEIPAVDAREERFSRHPSRAPEIAAEIAGGAAAGAMAGAIAGPVGAAIGAAIGGAIGAAVGYAAGADASEHATHDAQLDRDIGVFGGDLGDAPSSKSPPPRLDVDVASLHLSEAEWEEGDDPIHAVNPGADR